jgi:cell division protein FtsA
VSGADLVVGIDVGTTRVLTLVGEVSNDRVHVLGVGHSPSTGVRKGVVVDLPETVASIRESVALAEASAQVRIGSALVTISGEHLASLNSRGAVALGEAAEITEAEVRQSRRAARQIVLPPDRLILHNLPRQFVVDGQDGVRHPVGMTARHLEVETHLITAGGSFVENLVKCFQRAEVDVEEVVATPLAAGLAVATEAERALGVLVVDLGGGATQLAVFAEGSMSHSSVLPVGGQHFTHDLSVGLRLAREDAERLKRESGCALVAGIGEREFIRIRSVNEVTEREVPRRVVGEILEPRVTELAQLVRLQIERQLESATPPLSVVLTGGGSLLPGVREAFARELGVPARLGLPRGLDAPAAVLQSPAAAAAVGLLQYGAVSQERHPGAGVPGWSGSVFRRVARWLAGRSRPGAEEREES